MKQPNAFRDADEDELIRPSFASASRHDAELSPQLAQAPPALLGPDQGTMSAPITWLFEPESSPRWAS
jgi:hypothetical protein